MKRYITKRNHVMDSRNSMFLKNMESVDPDGKYDDEVEYMLTLINSPSDYFSYDKYDNFLDVVKTFAISDEDKDAIVNDVESKLKKYGSSVYDTVYEVDWGTEPLYLVKSSNGNLVIIDTATDENGVMTFQSYLNRYFPNIVERVLTRSDVELAVKSMQ